MGMPTVISRRTIVAGGLLLPAYARAGNLMLTGAGVTTSTGRGTGPAIGAFPGQAGNPVGHTAAPGFTSLTPFSGSIVNGVAGNLTLVSFKDFDAGTSGTFLDSLSTTPPLQYVRFFGCRFQSNSVANYNVGLTNASNIEFVY